MSQRVDAFFLRGGLDLVTPAISIPKGHAIAAVNYEPVEGGCARLSGYERFDGRPAPSEGVGASEIASRRAAIEAVPGAGPVRGVCVYDGAVYVFRDTVSGAGAMWKSSAAGWVQQTFGHVLNFVSGTAAFSEGEVVTGGTSSATGTIKRVVIRTGTFGGSDAAGYLVISSKVGTFQNAETVTSPLGSATCSGEEAVSLSPGGVYTFAIHNFFGPAKRPRLYFANGVGTAFEWDGAVLAPIRTGTDNGPLDLAAFVLEPSEAGTGYLTLPDGGRLALPFDFDKPSHLAPFKSHLFLGFPNGGIVFSGTGEPLDFRTTVGAGEISFTSELTGFIADAATAMIFFGRNRIDYLIGNDSTDFDLRPLSDASGAFAHSIQMLDEPLFLDDAGVRRLSTTDRFGDWVPGTLTRMIEPLMRSKRLAGVLPAASMRVRGKTQYRLFWADGTGLVVFLGRERAESLPIKLPITISCAHQGEISAVDGGERLFVGAADGYVYEMDRGTSFDGAAIPAYIRFAWNAVGAAMVNKRFHKATIELDAPSSASLGIAFEVDYSRRADGARTSQSEIVAGGSRTDLVIDDYANVAWSDADQGLREEYLDTFGRNIAITVLSESATEEAHTLASLVLNYTPRGLVR